MHALVTNPVTAPNKPALQFVHVDDPAVLYVPAGHTLAPKVTVPTGHANPAGHTPLHADVVAPLVLPY